MCGNGWAGILPEPWETNLLPQGLGTNLLVQPPPFTPFTPSHVNAPDTDLSKLPDGYTKRKASVPIDYYSAAPTFFQTAYHNIQGAAENVAPGIPEGWAQVSTGIKDAYQAFQQSLDNLPEGWKGQFAEAAVTNMRSSFPIIETLIAAASAMQILTQAFANTMATTRSYFVSNYPHYQSDVNNLKNQHQLDQIMQNYSNHAYALMDGSYKNNILAIADGNPNFNAGPPPSVDKTAVAGSSGTSKAAGAASGSGSGTSLDSDDTAATLDSDDTAATVDSDDTAAKDASTDPSTATTDPSATTTDPSTATTDPSTAAASGLESLASPLQGLSSLGQSMSGLGRTGLGRNVSPGALGAAKGPGKLPEGALALGSKGGAGASGGSGVRGPAIDKPAGAPATAAGTTSGRTVAAGTRAGLSSAPGSAAGAPAAGAPGAGHQGGAAAGAPHQPSKVLRRKKNGEEIIGDAKAVVAVLGEPTPEEAAKPPTAT